MRGWSGGGGMYGGGVVGEEGEEMKSSKNIYIYKNVNKKYFK